MDIVTLPVQLSAQTLSSALPGDSAADPGAPVLPQDLFAALLAGQMGAVGGAALAAAGAFGREAADADARPGRDEPVLAGEAVLPGEPALPALLAGLVAVQPTQGAPAEPVAESSPAGPALQGVMPGARQPVAAVPAAFAAGVAEPGADAEGAPFMVAEPPVSAAGPSAPNPAVALQPPPAAAAPAPQAAPPAAASIPQQVSGPAWGEALGERVIWMVGQQHQGAELRLNPPALGPLEIRLSMSDGQASLTFSTQHLPVREAIEAATPRLREMFNESGISLGSVSVNVGSFTQQQSGEQPVAGGGASGWAPAGPAEADGERPLPSAVMQLGRGRGMVDIFA